MTRTFVRFVLASGALAVLTLAGCSSGGSSPSASASPTVSSSPSPSPSPSASPTPEPVPLDQLTFSVEPWASGFSQPLFVTSRPLDYRVYVVEKGGKVIALSANGSIRRVALDLSKKVTTNSERGLLSIAFDPIYPWRMFVDYTNTSGTSVIQEYRFPLDAWEADPTPVRTILTQSQPYANHDGGQLAFGPDGRLYIGFGDGGSGGDPHRNGQNPKTRLATILRVDIHTPDGYTIPADNPFADGKKGAPEVWVYGLRNPWRFSFDGNDLYIGDVGQNRMEEIDMVDATTAAGSNFGWRTMEGTLCYPSGKPCNSAAYGFVNPLHAYLQDEHHGLCAVTGGYVYRGTASPGLWGTYLYSDYCGGGIFALRVTDGKVSEFRATGVAVPSVSSFGVDANGEIYVADIVHGKVYHLSATSDA